MRTPLLAAILAAACSGAPSEGNKPDPTGGDPDPTPDPPVPTSPPQPTCENTWVAASPRNGETGVFYRTPVVFELAEPDPTAVISVAERDGAEVPGESTVDGTVVTWTGGPLAADTDYDATVTHACGADTVGFTTSEVGDPVAVALAGRTWALDFASGTWVEPPGAGAVIGKLLADFRLMIAVTGTPDTDTIPLLAGIGFDGDQNPCAPTVDLADSAWTDPYFAFEAPRIDMTADDFSVTIADFAMTGAFAPDGSRIQGATLAGIADTRGLGEEFGLGSAPEAVCELLATFTVSCLPCDDGVVSCLQVDVQGISGIASPVPLVPIEPDALPPYCFDTGAP